MSKTENPPDLAYKFARSCAETFVQAYYPSLNNPKTLSTLQNYYLRTSETSSQKPNVVINGNAVTNPLELPKMFQPQLLKCAHYEVQCYDTTVLNSNYRFGDPAIDNIPGKEKLKFSLLIMISGCVQFWKDTELLETKTFSDSIVLIPNKDSFAPVPPDGARKWLILNQNFRILG